MGAMTVGLTGLLIFIEGQLSGVGVVASRLSVHASILATLLLALSATLYLAHALVRDPHVGRVASALAAAGASGVIGASLVRWVEVEWLAPGVLDYSSQYESLTWVAAIAVYLYLCVEDVYETRLAGGFVLPSVVTALGLAAWLIAVSPVPEQTFMALAANYVAQGLRLCAVVGVGAVVAIGAVGIFDLARFVGPHSALVGGAGGRGRWHVRTSKAHDRAMRWLTVVAFCAFSLAAMLGAARQFLTRVPELDPGPPALWLDIAALFLAWTMRRAPRDPLAWWTLIAIALVGIAILTPGISAFVGGMGR